MTDPTAKTLSEIADGVGKVARRIQALARHEPQLTPGQRHYLRGAGEAMLAALPLLDHVRAELEAQGKEVAT